ncbi:hypothetical protein M3197_13770 [Sporosarcina aquimarina]|uniref:hypothetical protein n=1 Tax=Sporosarcina aquimarina TaxID=114975 RepID=UPI00203C8184|nr:hypothetical protein [Sporosarcina aquimarina]MCM3758530.1 hypothetical protein [Sporosarcina aquimarina]
MADSTGQETGLVGAALFGLLIYGTACTRYAIVYEVVPKRASDQRNDWNLVFCILRNYKLSFPP